MELDFGGIFQFFSVFWFAFGQNWAQERAQRPRLEKRYINQRKLALEIDSKALIGLRASAERRVELDPRTFWGFFSGPGWCFGVKHTQGLVKHPPGSFRGHLETRTPCGFELLACCAKQLQKKTYTRRNRANQREICRQVWLVRHSMRTGTCQSQRSANSRWASAAEWSYPHPPRR